MKKLICKTGICKIHVLHAKDVLPIKTFFSGLSHEGEIEFLKCILYFESIYNILQYSLTTVSEFNHSFNSLSY